MDFPVLGAPLININFVLINLINKTLKLSIMKTLKFTFALLVAMIFASCSTTKISYEEYMTRQAEPVMFFASGH